MTEKKTNAANSTKTAGKKVVGRPFKKGQSGNPSGRPKKDTELAKLCQEIINDNQLIEKLVAKLNAADDLKDYIAGLKVLLERGYGKAPETITHKGDEENPINIMLPSATRLIDYAKKHGIDIEDAEV